MRKYLIAAPVNPPPPTSGFFQKSLAIRCYRCLFLTVFWRDCHQTLKILFELPSHVELSMHAQEAKFCGQAFVFFFCVRYFIFLSIRLWFRCPFSQLCGRWKNFRLYLSMKVNIFQYQKVSVIWKVEFFFDFVGLTIFSGL